MLNEFLSEYGTGIINMIFTAFLGAIGIIIKNIYKKYVNEKTKKHIVKTCVLAVEQIYKDLHGQEKYDKCMEAVTEMLNERGIPATELELKMLIESEVKKINDIIWKDDSDVQDANDKAEQ